MARKMALGFVLVFFFASLVGVFAQTCSDSDKGKVYDVKGTVAWNGYSVTDACLDPQTLIENYCLGNVSANETYTCQYNCSGGACLSAPICTDSDGGRNYHLKGTVKWNGYSVTDACLDSRALIENYCEGDAAVNETYECPYGCKEGACIKASSSCTGSQCTLYLGSPAGTTINGEYVTIEAAYISTSSTVLKVNGVQSVALAKGTSSNIAGFNVFVNDVIYVSTGNYAVVTISKATNATCPAMIDVEFGKAVYYTGETGRVVVKVYDSQGNPMPNQKFLVRIILYGQQSGPGTYYTDSRGIYESSGTVSLAGKYEYTVYTEEAGCDSVSDTAYVEFRTKCGDGYCLGDETPADCPQDCGVCKEGEAKTCGSNIGACRSGWMYCRNGKWSVCEGSIDPVPEICGNGLDDDCNGLLDEACECPARIDLAFGKSVYYVGDTGSLKVIVYGPQGSIMSNQQFKATGYLDGKPMGYESTFNTGPTGIYTSSGTITDSYVGTLRYDVWINSSNCGSISDSETITVRESPIKISISSVWSDKNYYTTGEGVKISAKVIDTDGTPAEPGEGTSVSFSLYSPDKYYTSVMYAMEYNQGTGYYEKTIKAPGEGAWWVHATAAKDGQTAKNSEYYFKVASETSFIRVAFDQPVNGETVSGKTLIRATAKSSVKLREMSLSVFSENTGAGFPLTNCEQGGSTCAAGEVCRPVYSMTCTYEWDTSSYQGKVGLSVTATNDNGDVATDHITVYVTEGEGFIAVNIESPREGETVSGIQIVRAAAKSSAELTDMNLAMESENMGISFPLTNCYSGATACQEGTVCKPVYSMTCTYEWDTSNYRGKKVSLSVTANNREGKTAGDYATVYVGTVVSGWTEEEVRKAFESMPFASQYGLEIIPKKGYEILEGIGPVLAMPLKRIVEPWKKYWTMSSGRKPPVYHIILEDASGPSPESGEFLVFFSRELLKNQTLPSGVMPLERAEGLLLEKLNLEKFETGEAGLILLNFGGMVTQTETVKISQIATPTAAAATAGGGTGMITGGIVASTVSGGEAVIAPAATGGAGAVREMAAYWVIKGTGIRPDGSTARLEILMDARSGEILVGPTPDMEERIRRLLEQGFIQLGLEISQIRQVSEEEMEMEVSEMRDMCDKIGPLDRGGTYWFVSDTEGILRLFLREGGIIQPVVIEKLEPPTSLEIKESISEAEKAAIVAETKATPVEQPIPITGGIVATQPAVGGGGGGGAIAPAREEIIPILMIFDVNRLSGLPGLNDYARQSIRGMIEGTSGLIKDDLGAGDLKLHELYMVMMYSLSYQCPACPEGMVCKSCVSSPMRQFAYAKGLTGGEKPVKFEYILSLNPSSYSPYDILCKRTGGIEKNQLNAHLWTSRGVAAPGDSIIIKSRVTDYLGNPVPNARVALTMGALEGVYTCPVCEVPPEIKTQIAQEKASTGIGGGYACRPCVYEEEVIQTIVGETDGTGTWTYLLKIANIRSGKYKLELKAEKSGYISGFDKKTIVVNNIGPVENRTFDAIDLVRIVLRLETTKINILKLKPVVQAIADYYISVGETDKADSWQGVVNTIDAISSHIEDVKKSIKDLVDNPSGEKLIAIKGEIVKIKKEIEDLLMEIIRVA